MRRIAISIMVAVSLLASSLSWAGGAFSLAELNKFITDYPALAAKISAAGQSAQGASGSGAWQDMRLSGMVQDFLKSRGWSLERFNYLGDHVSRGLAAVQAQKASPKMESSMSQAQAAIMDNPALSAAMKQQMMSQMGQSADSLAAVKDSAKDLPPSEMELIRANLPRIMDAFSMQ